MNVPKKKLYEYYKVCSDLNIDYSGDLNISVKSVTNDSRKVVPGSLFIAIKGSKQNGQNYITHAVKKGAIGIVYMGETELSLSVPSFRVSNDYAALGRIAEYHFGYPAREMKVVGVTGTNGKSTTAFILRSIVRQSKVNTGLIGTIQNEIGDKMIPSEMTTPSPLDLQKLLLEMKNSGVQVVIMEVSSHALDQNRLGTLKFDVAIFTNLTSDHLDYHIEMENYYQAKKRLFLDHLKINGTAIVNLDDPYGKRLNLEILQHEFRQEKAQLCSQDSPNMISFGLSKSCYCHSERFNISLDETKLDLSYEGFIHNLTYPLIGIHNVHNVMAAFCASTFLKVPFSIIKSAINNFGGISGRLQRIGGSGKVNIFIDYAHTENALENVLRTLKPLCKGKLVVVFGCGGDRDKGKRLKMGEVASRYANRVVVTSDNPRTEKPETIIEEILKGIPKDKPCKAIVDRKKAIQETIAEAEPFDTILIAGKGHEEYQEIYEEKLTFSDLLVTQEAMQTMGLIASTN